MAILSVFSWIVYIAFQIFFVLMWSRLLFDLATSFIRGFKPRGPLLILAEVAYTVTDPPIRAVRKFVPPLRIGAIAIDFGWPIVFLAATLAMNIVLAAFRL